MAARLVGKGRGIPLGPCCVCGGLRKVRNILALSRLAPMPGRGWGCVVCGLPSNGAQAVVCNPCMERMGHHNPYQYLQWVCTGFPGTDGRTPIGQVTGHQEHDLVKHGIFESLRG